MHLVATFKLRVGNHDRCRLDASLGRWREALGQALAAAEKRSRSGLLACIVKWTSKDGKREAWVTDEAKLKVLVLECVDGVETHLHSATAMNLVVVLGQMLSSYLGLYAAWLNGQRQGAKPAFPALPPTSPAAAQVQWSAVLDRTNDLPDLGAEDEWRAELMRGAKDKTLPQYFGSCASGLGAQAHCGLLRRADGQYFALLTLFGAGDPLGEPLRRARNRVHRGPMQNVQAAFVIARSTQKAQVAEEAGDAKKAAAARQRAGVAALPFAPSKQAKASIICPLELERGHERLFFHRAVPKSAELIRRDGEYFFHVAFEFPEHTPRTDNGSVLALTRGVNTLVAAVVLTPDGRFPEVVTVDGKELSALVTAIGAARAKVQADGKLITGDRRVSRVAERHLYAAAHRIVDLACRHQVREIVLLKDAGSPRPHHRKLPAHAGKPPAPRSFLRYRHWRRLADILGYLLPEAGLPKPTERKVYGSLRQTWLCCGWQAGDAIRHPGKRGQALCCPGCGRERHPTHYGAQVLAVQDFWLRIPNERRPAFPEWLRRLRQK